MEFVQFIYKFKFAFFSHFCNELKMLSKTLPLFFFGAGAAVDGRLGGAETLLGAAGCLGGLAGIAFFGTNTDGVVSKKLSVVSVCSCFFFLGGLELGGGCRASGGLTRVIPRSNQTAQHLVFCTRVVVPTCHRHFLLWRYSN